MRLLGDRFRVVVLWLGLVAAFATPSKRALAAVSDDQKKDLAQQLDQLIKLVEPMSQVEACAKLNPPFFTAREYLRQGEHAVLRAAFQKALSVRSDRGCLIRCPKDNPQCGDKPKYAWEWHKALEASIKACRQAPPKSEPAPECRDIDGLEKAFRLNFLMLIRILPVGDAQLQTALDDVMITVDPGSAMNEVLRAVALGKYSSDQLAKVVKEGLASPKAHEFLSQLTSEVTALFSQPQKGVEVSQKDLLALVIAAIRLVQKDVSGPQVKQLAEAIATLTGNDEVDRLLEAHRLVKGNQLEIIFASLQLLAKQNADFLEQLTREQRAALSLKKLPSKELLIQMVHAVNNAQMAELRRLTLEVKRGRYMEPQFRQFRLATVTRLPPECDTAPDDPACALAREFNEAILSVVGWGALVGMTCTHVKANTKDTLELVESVLRGRLKAACDASRFGELCTEIPYVGVLVLEFRKLPGSAPATVAATASFRLLDQDPSLRVGDGVAHGASIQTAENAQVEGGIFGRHLLRQTGLSAPSKWFPSEKCPKCQVEHSRPSWRQWAALGSVVGGGVTAATGVYVSNTRPDSALGDRLWQGGLVLLGTAAVFQIWELVHD